MLAGDTFVGSAQALDFLFRHRLVRPGSFVYYDDVHGPDWGAPAPREERLSHAVISLRYNVSWAPCMRPKATRADGPRARPLFMLLGYGADGPTQKPLQDELDLAAPLASWPPPFTPDAISRHNSEVGAAVRGCLRKKDGCPCKYDH